MKHLLQLLFAAGLTCTALGQTPQTPIYESSAFSVYLDRIVQGKFEAIAESPKHIRSDYRSAANEFMSPRIDFKFSINGKDNEMPSGKDHHFNCVSGDGSCETPLIVFGEQLKEGNEEIPGVFLKPDTKLTLKLDMRRVFKDFDSKGYFDAFNGSRIYKNDFKGVFVAGGTAPLTWDFDNLHNHAELQLHDKDGDHIYEHTLILNSQSSKSTTSPEWRQTIDTKNYPQYTSDHVLSDALYNLSLEEMVKAIEKDSTLRTGKEWAGVWTRDVSYSIILSMAVLQNKVAQHSLMRKVKNGMIIQDTGTGGAYPVSTDRMVWAIAAWEIYKVNGDKSWLQKTYAIIKKSLEADLSNAIDASTGLVRGESSFLDWREQTYPDWMQPADIFESRCLGTNAVHFQANKILALMAEELDDTATFQKHHAVAEQIKEGINKYLWIAESRYYGQFLYGKNFDLLSPKSEALGEALCVLFDIADPTRAKQMVAAMPVNAFGIPCIFPQIPNIPPYHNNAVWPFVQSYWALAAAKAGNEKSVMHSIATIARPAALFLTNKENFVANTGDYASTQINSDNMLWSLSGSLAVVYKVLFGMQFETTGLVFKPFVPEKMAGKRVLANFKYRSAVLNITMNGFGSRIKAITLDGKPLPAGRIDATLKGEHEVNITLANNKEGSEINLVADRIAPQAPALKHRGGLIWWNSTGERLRYKVIVNGRVLSTQSDTTYRIGEDDYQECHVIAVDEQGIESFASEPLMIVPESQHTVIEAEKFTENIESRSHGFSGKGYVKTDINARKSIAITVSLKESGAYAIDFRYANGHGPVNTENKCGIRSLIINGKKVSTIVFPQRGKDEWSDWGFTNSVLADLPAETNEISLTYDEYNVNMNGEINEAVIDYLRVIKVD